MRGRLGRVEAVTFDAGGTLWRTVWDPVGIWKAFLEERGVERAPEEIRRALRGWPVEAERIPRNRREERAYFLEADRRVARTLGFDLTSEGFAAVEKAFQRMTISSLFPDTLPTLERLRARGIPMGVISNSTSDLVELLDSLRLSRFLDPVVYSFGHGVEKPDPRIFRIALEGLGRSPDRVVHVGDTFAADVEGALGAGMMAVHLVREGDPRPGDHVTVRSLEELDGIIP